MEITVLGCGTNIPNPKKSGPCFYIKDGKDSVLLDMGPNSLRNMLKAGIDRFRIENILFTHFHSDHFSDLVIFMGNRDYTVGIKKTHFPRLNIYLPRGFSGALKGFDKFPGVANTYASAKIKELWKRKIKISNFNVTPFPLSHRKVVVVGVRLEKNGKSVAYTGDTGVCSNLFNLLKGVDLAIVECAFPKRMKIEGHLNSQEVGQIAQKVGVKTLVLTHIYPFVPDKQIKKEVQKYFKGEVILARDLLRIKV